MRNNNTLKGQLDHFAFIIPLLGTKSLKKQSKTRFVSATRKKYSFIDVYRPNTTNVTKPRKSACYLLSHRNSQIISKCDEVPPSEQKEPIDKIQSCILQTCTEPSSLQIKLNHKKQNIRAQSFIKHDKKQKTTLKKQDIELKGIFFKKKHINPEEVSPFQSEKSMENVQKFISAIKRLKYNRRNRSNQKQKSLNVEAIILRKASNFDNLMHEFCRRMSLVQNSRIFIFDSSDNWMKRVLIQRGWVQNINKESRAFHLKWGCRIEKNRYFTSQSINHYPNSDQVTSKANLQKLLQKYNITALQPLTFDLSQQRQQFIYEFWKYYAFSLLKKILYIADQKVPISINQTSGHQDCTQFFFQRFYQIMTALLRNSFQLFLKLVHQLYLDYEKNLNFIYSSDWCDSIWRTVQKLYQCYVQCRQRGAIMHLMSGGVQNIWIIKSKNCSKGAGISLSSSIEEILNSNNKLIQKYIEYPLIFAEAPKTIKQKKFDLRVWVLVTGNSKLRMFYFEQFYAKICFEKYSINKNSLKKNSVHLSNYSINKSHYQFEDNRDRSIMTCQDLFNLLQSKKQYKRSQFYSQIQKLLAKLYLPLVSELKVQKQDCDCFQLFGCDLLLDNQFHLHLLEINLSAKCDERQGILSQMLQKMANGVIDLAVDKLKTATGWKEIVSSHLG